MRSIAVLGALLLAGCAAAPEPVAKATPATAAVKDNSSLLPQPGRVSTRLVPDHLLEQQKMPGGTLGDYSVGAKKYQLFIIETESNQKAALVLLDLKEKLQDPEYLPSFGGYFGGNGTAPVFAFARLKYLAGVVGLPKEEAEPVARVLAARLK